MNIDFSTLLVVLTFGSGLVWLAGHLLFVRHKKVVLPAFAIHARSFFPVFLIVLLLRSFVIEPFRIPSNSMMPTLLTGDFILVNKYDYGLRLPVFNMKIFNVGNPKRGDIIVFRYPKDPSIPFIKRVVGLPGDSILYDDQTLHINGNAIEQTDMGKYRARGAGFKMDGAFMRREKFESTEYDILLMQLYSAYPVKGVVPAGHYFVLGDNRDNSRDSRFWGYVPDENLMGRAFLVWMNWDSKNNGIVDWKRIGMMLN